MLVDRLKPFLIATATLAWCSPALAQANQMIGDAGAAALADGAPSESPIYAISFEDPARAFEASNARNDLAIELAVARNGHKSPFGLRREQSMAGPRREFALELAAGREQTGLGLDVSVQRRASFDAEATGDIEHAGGGSELRLGRFFSTDKLPDAPTWYMFAASDDEALTWRPGGVHGANGAGAFSLQDRVEIGDMQAGVTYQNGPMQASIAYVERDVSVQTGIGNSISRAERFTGVTLTLSH